MSTTILRKDILALLDTNTIESINHFKPTDQAKSAALLTLITGKQLVVTDFSLVELVEGRRNIDEFNQLRQFVTDYSIGFFGHSKAMSEYGKKGLDEGFTSEDDFLNFKQNLSKIKVNFLRPHFAEMSIRFLILLSTVLAYEDREYFVPLQVLLYSLYKNQLSELKQIAEETIEGFFHGDYESDNLIFDYAVTTLEAVCEAKKPGYVKDEVLAKISALDVPTKLPTITSKAIEKMKKNDEYKELRKYTNNVRFLIELFKRGKQLDTLENRVMDDGLTYGVIMSGFCQGKFQKNDLVDIYNLSCSAVENESYSFVYYTDEGRWNRFAKMEIEIEPDLEKHIHVKMEH